MRYELKIALRYLRARRKDAFISITTIFTAVGVMIGVAALVVMLAVMSGFEPSLRQRMLSLSPQVQISSFDGSISDYATIEKPLDHTCRRRRVESVYRRAGDDEFAARGIGGVVVRGVEPRQPGRRIATGGATSTRHHSTDARERLSADSGGMERRRVDGLLLGVTLADKLKVKRRRPGADRRADNRGPGFAARARAAPISGRRRFSIRAMQFIDRDVVFMGSRHGAGLLRPPGQSRRNRGPAA